MSLREAQYAKIRDVYEHLVPKPGDTLPIKGLVLQVGDDRNQLDRQAAGGRRSVHRSLRDSRGKAQITGDHGHNMIPVRLRKDVLLPAAGARELGV